MEKRISGGMKLCIESIDEWNVLAETLIRLNYCPYCTQFDASDPDGFLALLWSIGYPDVKVVTHSNAVQNAIKDLRSISPCPPFISFS
jgi:hypothetical protein